MVKGTGYMPPNSVPANDPKMLKTFYADRPNHLTSLTQQPFMTAWYAFPGENNLKIIATIKDRLQTVVDKSAEPKAALAAMSDDVASCFRSRPYTKRRADSQFARDLPPAAIRHRP